MTPVRQLDNFPLFPYRNRQIVLFSGIKDLASPLFLPQRTLARCRSGAVNGPSPRLTGKGTLRP